ncbi:hypothetical protein V6N13_145491 [Hibiscus sabdariffa]
MKVHMKGQLLNDKFSLENVKTLIIWVRKLPIPTHMLPYITNAEKTHHLIDGTNRAFVARKTTFGLAESIKNKLDKAKVNEIGEWFKQKILSGHQKAIASVSWSPDNHQLLTCAEETIRRWDVASGECLQVYGKIGFGTTSYGDLKLVSKYGDHKHAHIIRSCFGGLHEALIASGSENSLTEAVSANYVMKTDDDAFVRVDEVLATISKENVRKGLLYGLINYDAQPHRNEDSKWYISPEEYPKRTYPPWAHGPGYAVSNDIAKAVYTKHKEGTLRMIKLEDVAMGIWISEMKKEGLKVKYMNEKRVYNEGCNDGFVVAHYQSPREMLCLWQKLKDEGFAKCCN